MSVTLFVIYHCCMYKHKQHFRYLTMESIIFICKNIYFNSGINFWNQYFLYVQTFAVLLVYIVAINHLLCTITCSIASIYCCYQSLFYVQKYAVFQVPIDANNHCYMYKYLQYFWYILLITINFNVRKYAVMLESISANNHLYIQNNM